MRKYIIFIVLSIFSTTALAAGHAPPQAFLGINIASARGQEDGPVEGVLVVGVTPGGPAEAAGLAAQDVLVAIDELPLTAESAREANGRLLGFMAGVAPGDEVEIDYLRGADSGSVKVVAGDAGEAGLPESMMGGLRKFRDSLEREFGRPMFQWRHHGLFAGMELVELTPDLGRYFGVEEGLLVVRAPESDQVKLRDGDVITAIGGRVPTDPGHAMRILRSYEPGEKLAISVVREERKRNIEIVVPEPKPEPAAPPS